MPEDRPHPDWPPKCTSCGRATKLVGIEADEVRQNTNIHTFECECGEQSAVQVTQM
jgi:hypothetical protein